MDAIAVPAALADRLGPEATAGLAQAFEALEDRCVMTAGERAVDRFERRLMAETSTLRLDMVRGHEGLRREISESRAALQQQMTMLGGSTDLRDQITSLGSDLRHEIATQGSDLRQEIASQGTDLRKEIAILGSDLRQEIGGLRQEMARQQFDLLKWSFLFWIGQVVAIATLLRMTGH